MMLFSIEKLKRISIFYLLNMAIYLLMIMSYQEEILERDEQTEDRQTDRQADRQTGDRLIDRQIDRQTDR